VGKPWKDGGVYLITGGAGGLGRIFAQEIAQQTKGARLILTGRSEPDAGKEAQLAELEILGATAAYRQVDITNAHAVEGLIDSIVEDFGSLQGIIHSAGINRDSFIIRKTAEECSAVLAPKVAGLVNLDEASKAISLDCFICFSSVAGALGNVGQGDYAAGNGFMDAYAAYRNSLVAAGHRHGQTLSMNWPLWAEGGMQVNAATEQMMTRNTGMIPLKTASGIDALYRALGTGRAQVMVMEGELERLRARTKKIVVVEDVVKAVAKAPLAEDAAHTVQASTGQDVLATGQDQLQEKAVNYFKKLLSSVLKLPVHRIEADAPMEKYGIDSVMVMQLTGEL
jgi:polyketide synthase PksN